MSKENKFISNQSAVVEREILSGKRQFLSLNLADPIEKEIALSCIKQNESFVYLLDANNLDNLKVILSWLSGYTDRQVKYKKIYKLTRGQLNKDILDVFLAEKLDEGKKAFDNCLDVYKGFYSDVVLSYDYETKDGETLCYFDKTLNIPARLKVVANFKLKIEDSVKLVKKIDVALPSITLDCVMNTLNNGLNMLLRDTLLPIIEDNNLTYYQLSRNYTSLANSICQNSKNILGEIGFKISELVIKDIALINDSGKMLEEQYFALAEAERVNEFENRVNEASLALYEKKAMIHEKYPNFPVSLTEAEKDFAFDRYLKKELKGNTFSAKLNEIKLDARLKPEKIVKPVAPELTAPTEPLAPKYLKGVIAYAVLFALFAIASVVLIILGYNTAGFIALGVTVGVFGIIGIVFAMLIKKNRAKYPSRKEFKKMYEEYEKQLELYHEKQAE